MEEFLLKHLRAKKIWVSQHPPNKPTFIELTVAPNDEKAIVGELRPLASHFVSITPKSKVVISPGGTPTIRISGKNPAVHSLVSRLMREAGVKLRKK